MMPGTALSWWQLPGPARLVAAVADDLDRGRCAVLALPAHAPAGFYPAVQQALRSIAGQPQRWRAPHLPALAPPELVDSPPLTPQAWLHHYLPPTEADAAAPATALGLAQRPGFGGYRVLLQPTAADAPAWLAWLAEYQQALLQVRHAERTLFLLVLTGAAALLLPPATAGLPTHAYRHHASTTDLALHLHFTCPRPPHEPALLHRVRLSVAAALAPFDPETAQALATCPLATLLQPAAWLSALAQQRAWPSSSAFKAKMLPAEAEELWAAGLRVAIDGHPVLHPAALAQHGQLEALATRIWEGQLPVLLPFLEQRRQALLQHLAERLRPLLPYQNASGETLRRLEEIEVGDLFRLCISSGHIRLPEAATRAEIRLLRDCRNLLAHLNPVPEAEVLALAALQQQVA
jgi:hypothetical protein